MNKTITIERNISIDAPIEQVWRVSAEEFEDIDRWDANVKSSISNEHPVSGSASAGRICTQYNGRKIVEELIETDVDRTSFSYRISKGLPGFVESAINTWRLEKSSSTQTRLTMTVIIQVRGLIGTMMSVPMKAQMGKILGNAQEELKHFIEKGLPHPRKSAKLG
ncbi:MAG: SRPBCC family protein [Pseudomonadota bacterium]